MVCLKIKAKHFKTIISYRVSETVFFEFFKGNCFEILSTVKIKQMKKKYLKIII